MNKSARSVQYGSTIVGFSPYFLLATIALTAFTQYFLQVPTLYLIAVTVAGALLSYLLVELYRSGNIIYAALYGAGIGLSIYFTDPLNSEIARRSFGFFAPLFIGCFFSGIFLVFTLFRNRILSHIKQA